MVAGAEAIDGGAAAGRMMCSTGRRKARRHGVGRAIAHEL